MLADFIDKLWEMAADAVTPDPTTVDIDGETYLRTPHHGTEYSYQKVQRPDNQAHLSSTQVLDLGSMLAWANACAAQGFSDGELHISRAGVSHAYAPRMTAPHVRQEHISKAWFGEYLPPRTCRYQGLLSWVDGLGDGLQDREGIEAELRSLGGAVGKAKKVRMTGAVMQVQGETKQEVLGGLRRRFTARIPYGDPGFTTDVTFLVTCQASPDGDLLFSLDRMATDLATDAYLGWATKLAQEVLPPGWLLMVTP